MWKYQVPLRSSVVSNKFPEFCTTQVGSKIKSLNNYNLPDFILSLVAKECDSELAEKGRLDKKLHSMNDKAIDLLYQIFVNCAENNSGNYSLYRFYAYASSMYYKCETMINEIMPGKSGKKHLVPVAIKSSGMYISVAFSKNLGGPVTKKDLTKFYNTVDDLKNGPYGTQLADAVYCSSVGFMGNALVELENLKNNRKDDPETKINFKTSSFENRIYSLIKPEMIENRVLGV